MSSLMTHPAVIELLVIMGIVIVCLFMTIIKPSGKNTSIIIRDVSFILIISCISLAGIIGFNFLITQG